MPLDPCAICQSELSLEDAYWVPCAHCFHSLCIKGQTRCPICRHEFIVNLVTSEEEEGDDDDDDEDGDGEDGDGNGDDEEDDGDDQLRQFHSELMRE